MYSFLLSHGTNEEARNGPREEKKHAEPTYKKQRKTTESVYLVYKATVATNIQRGGNLWYEISWGGGVYAFHPDVSHRHAPAFEVAPSICRPWEIGNRCTVTVGERYIMPGTDRW